MSPFKLIISHLGLPQKLVTKLKCLELWALKYYNVSLKAGYYDSPCPRKPHQMLDNAASNADYLCGCGTPVITREIRETSWHTLPPTDGPQMLLYHTSWLQRACMRGRMQRLNLNTISVITGIVTQELTTTMPGRVF